VPSAPGRVIPVTGRGDTNDYRHRLEDANKIKRNLRKIAKLKDVLEDVVDHYESAKKIVIEPREETRLTSELTAIQRQQSRLTDLLQSLIIELKDVTPLKYQHEASYALDPMSSGIVILHPSVIFAKDQALDFVKRRLPLLYDRGEEYLLQDATASIPFIKLMAAFILKTDVTFAKDWAPKDRYSRGQQLLKEALQGLLMLREHGPTGVLADIGFGMPWT